MLPYFKVPKEGHIRQVLLYLVFFSFFFFFKIASQKHLESKINKKKLSSQNNPLFSSPGH
jgi:hypothetical protein